MGKKIRKTRWRTLTIADEQQSDSECSNTSSTAVAAPRIVKNYHQKSCYNNYSSQSTPLRRRYHQQHPHDISSKSTRSSSTTSENKITFNEDEYTRITTPRQDVLFKKGYLNKPKNFQTQTSTGTSITSTGNSTENGTPDHQSTDLDYESQFVFPNGFVDPNGIYYLNGYDCPFVLYNPPTYYPEFSNEKSKRYSTGSLTESMSPNNEEATSQDLSQSGGENSTANVSDFNNPIYNMVYSGFYVNGVGPTQDIMMNGANAAEPRRMKKRRRRKTSKTVQEDNNTSEYSDEDSLDEVFSDESRQSKSPQVPPLLSSSSSRCSSRTNQDKENVVESQPATNNEESSSPLNVEETETTNCVQTNPDEAAAINSTKLKADAEEFVPRAFRDPIMNGPVQFMKIRPNFVPVPIISSMGDFNGQNFNPAFIPINFIPPADPTKMYRNYVAGYVPNANNQFVPKSDEETVVAEELSSTDQNTEKTQTVAQVDEPIITAKIEIKKQNDRCVERVQSIPHSINIPQIVSKLEEAAKDQDLQKNNKTNQKYDNRTSHRYRNSYKKYNHYNKVTNGEQTNEHVTSPPTRQRRVYNQNSYASPKRQLKSYEPNNQNGNKNYSEILKKAPQPQMNPQIDPRKSEDNSKSNTPTKQPNQWISVLNRKKRKNKNLEEFDDVEDQITVVQDQEFETYDVSLLEDVVPSSQVAEVPSEATEATVQEVLIELALSEEVKETSSIEIPEVSEIEMELIPAEVAVEEVTEAPEEPEQIKPEIKTKKAHKQKKVAPSNKSIPRRIMITDIDLSADTTNVQSTAVIKEATPKVLKEITKEEVVEERKNVEVVAAPKVNKKKKKKTSKTSVNVTDVSLSSSNATLNNTDEPYDFLLETTTILDETIDKTNIEVSQELDKLIQKGMYNSLEEKIRSLNIEKNDGFFQTIMNSISSQEPTSVEKSSFLKSTTDFNKLLNPQQIFKSSHPVSVLEEHSKINVDFSKIALPDLELSTATKAGLFLEQPKTTKLSEDDENHQPTDRQSAESTTLYPITKAVKEWMSKTRETTPEIELLKSPTTIYKEFIGDEEIVDLRKTDTDVEEEEVTVFEQSQVVSRASSAEQDLLEYWDNDLECFSKTHNGALSCTQDNDGCANSEKVIDGDEEAIEVYESKYGKNEDFVNLQNEVRAHQANNNKPAGNNFPKHGALPYRAICCSLM